MADGGQVSNASRVVANMRSGFRACYNQGLSENPDIAGSVRLTIHVGAAGAVTRVTTASTGSLPPAVVECVRARAAHARFAPPEGGRATIGVPVTFVKIGSDGSYDDESPAYPSCWKHPY